MVILGITGTLSSGKETAAQYLHITLGFKIINLESDSWEETHPSKSQLGSDYESEEQYRISIANAALKSITSNLKQHAIVYPLILPQEILVFRKRSYFILLGIDSPPMSRYSFYCKKHGKPKNLLQGFIYMDDHTKYGLDGYPSRIAETLLSSDRVVQNKSTTEDFFQQLTGLEFLNKEYSRPSWDTYFIRLAEIASTRSCCLSGKKGAIIVNNFKVVATGYNGTPAQIENCSAGGCKACCEIDDSECVCIHAEINALIEAGRSKTIGSQMFCTHFPCLTCAKSIMQSEVKKLVYFREESVNEDVEMFLKSGGVEVLSHSLAIQFNNLNNE